MALTDKDFMDIRRHCGYGFMGTEQPGLMFWRYWHEFNTLEYRMAHLRQEEIDLLQGTYLPALNQLEMSPFGADDNLDTDQAAIWFHNKDEVADRAELYDYYRQLLCNMMQIPRGPFFTGIKSSIRVV